MVGKYNEQNGGEISKDLSTGFSKFQGIFSLDSIVMVIFKDEKVKWCPMENDIVVKPFDPSSMNDDYLVHKLWKTLNYDYYST